MKFQRQSMILKLIEEESIETQKELTEKLKAAGLQVTQATISRDIGAAACQVLDHDNKYKYAAATRRV